MGGPDRPETGRELYVISPLEEHSPLLNGTLLKRRRPPLIFTFQWFWLRKRNVDQVFGSGSQQVKSNDYFQSYECTTFYGNFIFAHEHLLLISK